MMAPADANTPADLAPLVSIYSLEQLHAINPYP